MKFGYKDDPIFLMSAEEYGELGNYGCGCRWWLRSPGGSGTLSSLVLTRGSMDALGESVESSRGVRPALDLSYFGLEGNVNRFVYLGVTWEPIDEYTAVAVIPIAFKRFDDKSNDYETSEIRQWLLDWADKGGLLHG